MCCFLILVARSHINSAEQQRERLNNLHVFVLQSALHSAPWGLMQALEQQVEDLKIDIDDGCCEGAQRDAGDSRPSSGNSCCLKAFLSQQICQPCN